MSDSGVMTTPIFDELLSELAIDPVPDGDRPEVPNEAAEVGEVRAE
jgi:hypothetical protein